MEKIFLLKDLAQASGISIYTIKYYYKLHLLTEFGRSPETNYRYFNEESVKRLKEIRRLRLCGMSIKDIQKRLQAEH